MNTFETIAAAIRPQEITTEDEQVFKEMHNDCLEDPVQFIDELKAKYSDEKISKGLDENYRGIELARGLIELFNDYVNVAKEVSGLKLKVKAADKQFDDMRKMIFDFQTNK